MKYCFSKCTHKLFIKLINLYFLTLYNFKIKDRKKIHPRYVRFILGTTVVHAWMNIRINMVGRKMWEVEGGKFSLCLLAFTLSGKFICPVTATAAFLIDIRSNCFSLPVDWRTVALQESSRSSASDWDWEAFNFMDWAITGLPAFPMSDEYLSNRSNM